ncbi:hypothetical protein AHF37_00131 [Paragonimus kellicotti]|nr:hypothetical protein AHF37_00131 [Paragonimus kellicotti]
MQAVALLLKSILLKGGFRLTKFYSNVEDAFTDIPKEDLSSVTVNLDRQQTEAQKALGVVWDSQSDNIRFKVSGWQDDWRYVDTKRNPADLASRGMHPKDQRTREWFSGPEFLWKDQVAWPAQPQGFSDELTELRPKERTQVFTT